MIIHLNPSPVPIYHLNDVLAIVDAQGLDIGARCRYIALTVGPDNQPTGEAHVVLLDRSLKRMQGNVNIDLKKLRLAEDLAKHKPASAAGDQPALFSMLPAVHDPAGPD